jgi:hypothetical protein
MDIITTGEQSKLINKLWTSSYFSNQEKTFIFKLLNNTLGFNNAVAHFVRGHLPFCTFCDIARTAEPNIETPLHLFFDCTHVSNIIETLFQRFNNDRDFQISRREFFSTL